MCRGVGHSQCTIVGQSGTVRESLNPMARGCAEAPADLVQIVTGYGEAGNALVTGGVDKLIFVGSTKVGLMYLTLLPPLDSTGGKCFQAALLPSTKKPSSFVGTVSHVIERFHGQMLVGVLLSIICIQLD